MLQQTRVETVIPYFLRFLSRFPTATALARASEDSVLSLWSGLGYYRRARQAHAAAKMMVADHGGRVPEDRAARLGLPGVGAYTAGAIGSIAFDKEEPIVDGNVARVLCRVHGLHAPLGSKESEGLLWDHAARWVKGDRPGALNQALMELGATVCTPVAPHCDRCPLAKRCTALSQDRVGELPVPRVRKAPKLMHLVAVCARKNDRVFLMKSELELFGGLYGLPTAAVKPDASAATVSRAARHLLSEVGLAPTSPLVGRGELVHVLTHRRLEVKLVSCEAERAGGTKVRALSQAERRKVGVSTLAAKLILLDTSSSGEKPTPKRST